MEFKIISIYHLVYWWQTDQPTDLPTDISKTIYPSSSKGGIIKLDILNLGLQWVSEYSDIHKSDQRNQVQN